MKIVFGCALLALLCVVAVESNPWGKYVQVTVNKNYDGPNFADILSNLVRQKMEFKNNLWNAFMNAKTKSYNYNYSSNQQPFTKTISINYTPVKTANVDVQVDKKVVEVSTQPPIPQKTAPLVEHEKTFEFKAQSSFSSSSAASSAGSSSGTNANSELIDIAEHQKENN